LRFGVILASASDTRRLVLSEAMEEKYTILRNGKVLFKNLTQEEYFDIMEDLSIEYYQKGSPNPSTLETKIIRIG
jgi:hypothetical protein